MKSYLNLLNKIIIEGVEKESGRANMPNTFGISHGLIEQDLQEGFPLLTTKKMYFKGIFHELIWFLKGETNIKYLVDNNTNIWNADAYRWYNTKIVPNGAPEYTIDEFLEAVKNGKSIKITDPDNDQPYDTFKTYKYGDLGKVYGYQWRNQNGVDQVMEVINGLKTNPFNRYNIIDGWNKADFKDMALPPCHLLYQFITRPDKENPDKNYLDLNMYQRSCDTFLGVPFNVASMSLFCTLMAKLVGMEPGVIRWIGGDTHIYVDHKNVVKEQLSRTPKSLPKLNIKKDIKEFDDILNLTLDDIEIVGYDPDPAIKAELFVGLKKK